MRKCLLVSSLFFILLLVAGTAYAESTEIHINIYNDTDEPFSFESSKLGISGQLNPGDHAYYRHYPTAYLWDKRTYGYPLIFKYGDRAVGEVVMSVTNHVNGVGAALVDHHDTEVVQWELSFWEHDFSTRGNDVQVNWYLHVRNK